jgi:hypothetical protein
MTKSQPKTNKRKIPRAAMILRGDDAPVELVAGGEDGPARFRMIANSGKPIEGHAWWGNFAVDLKGLQIGRQRKPTLWEHNSDRPIGYTDKITKGSGEGVVVEGSFVNTDDAARVQQLSGEGFPWQASVYVPPLAIEDVPEGKTIKVNGHELSGPGTVFRKSKLREVSFATLGADENTSATALSGGGDDVEVDVIEVSDTGDNDMSIKELTADQLSEQRPDLVAELKKQGIDEALKAETIYTAEGAEASVATARAAALTAERERVVRIYDQAMQFKLPKAGAKLIGDGTEFGAAMLQLKDAKIAALEKETAASPGPSDGDTPPDTDAGLSDTEKWEKHWDKDAELRSEFGGSKSAYLAFQRADKDGRVKILSR